jgi:uncharacterized protein YjbI with pentapeptide repeats
LTHANLSGADLSYADLSNSNLSYANLTGALYNLETVFSDGFDPVAEGMILVPEPATFLLIGLGGLMLRKRKA